MLLYFRFENWLVVQARWVKILILIFLAIGTVASFLLTFATQGVVSLFWAIATVGFMTSLAFAYARLRN